MYCENCNNKMNIIDNFCSNCGKKNEPTIAKIGIKTEPEMFDSEEGKNNNKFKKIKREEKILLLLNKLDYLTRDQLQKLVDMGNVNNANRVLRQMKDYINYQYVEQSRAYYLSKEGRERIGSELKRKKTMQIDHYIMRNDAYIYFGKPTKWTNEPNIHVENIVNFYADSMFFLDDKIYFLEVDNKQSMRNNIQKIKKYKKLDEINYIMKKYDCELIIIYLTTSKIRKERLGSLLEGLKHEILLVEDII